MKFVIPFFVLAFMVSVSAVVIVPPIVYVASLSILNLLVSLIIGFGLWLAGTGIWKQRGQNWRLIHWFDFLAPWLGAFLLASLAGFVVLVWFKPLSFSDCLWAGFGIALLVLMGSVVLDFKRFRILSKSLRRTGLIDLATRSLVLGILFGAAFFLSVEVKSVIVSPQSAGELGSEVGLPDSDSGILDSVLSKRSSESSMGASPPGEYNQQESVSSDFRVIVWVWPTSDSVCQIRDSVRVQSVVPRFSCFKQAPGQQRIFCPIPFETSFPASVVGEGSCENAVMDGRIP